MPDRINQEGTNVMFRINGEWTPPCNFDSYFGDEIQQIAGGVLCLWDGSDGFIELQNQHLQEDLEYDRNQFDLKWVNSKGESSFNKEDVDSEDYPAELKAFVKITKFKIPKEIGEKMKQHLKEKSQEITKRFPPKEVMDWMRQKTDEIDKLNGGTLDKSTFMLGMQTMWYHMNKENRKNGNFISVDNKTVISSYGQYFTVGEKVKHEDDTAGDATILRFEPITERNEIRVHTDKGYAHIDFLVKI